MQTDYAPLETDIIDDEGTLILDNIGNIKHQEDKQGHTIIVRVQFVRKI